MVKTRMTSAKSLKGFTLIELMIAIAIMGILLAIAMPNFTKYLLESRRAQAQTDMLQIRLGLEKWRANNNTYTSTISQATVGFTDNNDYYNYSITGTNAIDPPTGSVYVIRAAAVAGKSQVNDKTGSGTSCKDMTLNQNGDKTPADCWKK